MFRAYRLLLLIFCQVLNRGDIFGFVNSGIVDRPLAFLILIIDLDETPIPLNLIVIVVPEVLDWSNNNGVDANNGRDDSDILLLKIFRSHPEKRMKPPSSVRTFFISEQRKPLHRSTVNLLLRTYSAAASMPILAHPHMLRHACGFALADQGADTRLIQDYLGHRNIQHTVKYTASNPARFEKLWR